MARQKTTRPRPIRPDGYTYDESKPLVRAALESGLSVLLRGHPGIGKSSLAADLATEMGLPMVDIRLAQRDPADLGGVYLPDKRRRVLSLLAPDWVQQVCEQPGFVFLDEINAAVTRLHQSAAYQIVLEHRVGPFRFHPETVVMAAGNLEEDNAIVTRLSSALANRFVHFQLRVDGPAWLRWAEGAGLHPSLLAYFRAKGLSADHLLYENDGSDAFPTPRSWAMAGKVLEHVPPADRKRAVAACVGPGAAEQFFSHLRLYERFNPESVVRRGRKLDFTKGQAAEPSYAYTVVYAVADWLTATPDLNEKHFRNVLKFLRSPGLDAEYVYLFLRRIKAAEDVLAGLKRLPGFHELAREIVDTHFEAAS